MSAEVGGGELPLSIMNKLTDLSILRPRSYPILSLLPDQRCGPV
jgi:hypothetical protein